jgi:hypothetical protein
VIERLHEEFWRRVKTQGSLPTEDAALVLLFGLVASGQIPLRRVDGWRQIPAILRDRRRPPHDASRIGVRTAFDERPYTRVWPKARLCGVHPPRYAQPARS